MSPFGVLTDDGDAVRRDFSLQPSDKSTILPQQQSIALATKKHGPQCPLGTRLPRLPNFQSTGALHRVTVVRHPVCNKPNSAILDFPARHPCNQQL